MTGSNGAWSQSGLSGNVSISAYMNGYYFYPSTIPVSGPDNNVNFTAYYSVSGSVYNQNGNPISGVTISFSSNSVSPVITSSNGSWSQTGLSGQITITPSLSGYSFNPSNVTVNGPESGLNFTGTALPPNTPSNPTPYNGQTNVATNIMLAWTGGGANGDTITYSIYFGTTSTPSFVQSNLTSTSYNPGILSYDTTYYWQIVATDENNGSSSSDPIWSFTTQNQPVNPPNPPSNPSPSNGQTNISITPTLSWTGGGPNGDTITYDVYFGTSPTPSLTQSNLTSTSYNPGTLSYDTTYYWQIVADDANTGLTVNGPVWSFTTQSQPAPSTYSISGQITDINGNGISGVTISFSGGYSSVTTGSNGYWSKSGLTGSVTVVPYMNDYTFVPSSINVTGSNSGVNFSGYLNVSGNMSIINQWSLSVPQNGQNVAGQIYSSPAISTDGTIFIGGTGGLFSVQNGTVSYVGGVLNSSNSLVKIWSSPAVDPNNDDVFVGTNNGYVISTQYPFNNVYYPRVSQNPIIGAPLCFNGNVYVVDEAGNIYEMSETSMSTSLIVTLGYGNEVWTSPITNGTDLLIGTTAGNFYAINLSTDQTDWTYSIGSQQILDTAAIGPNGNIYFAGTNLYSVAPNGQLRWSVNLDGSQITGSPVVSGNGVVYIGTSTGDFYAVNSSNGNIIWQDNLSTQIGGISGSALIGNNGVVYVASGWVLYALNAGTGTVISSISLGYNIESSPVLNDGYIYIGCDDGNLYQIQALSTNISSAGWPMFMDNWYHTGLGG
jgi:outer membrane protein assembly factor BamB